MPLPLEKLFVLVLLVMTGCGQAVEGGVVDNGNKPRKPDDPQTNPQDPKNPDNPPPSPDLSTSMPVVVLVDYLVTVPSADWKVESDVTSTVLGRNDQRISFTSGGDLCDVSPEKNQAGIEIFWCEKTRAVLKTNDGVLVSAAFGSRTADGDSIVRSFRRK